MTAATQVTAELLADWPLPRPGEDKNSRGRVLIVGGSRLAPGGVMLAAEAALRAGAGKAQVVTVDSIADQLAVRMPECLVRGAPETKDGNLAPEAVRAIVDQARSVDVVLLGPGLLDPSTADDLVLSVLPDLEGAVVLDAMALGCLASSPDALHHLTAVLTPNTDELGVALGVREEDDYEPDLDVDTVTLARRTGAVVTCGSSRTVTADPDARLWHDDAGGSGLGVSGSGDVLSGLVLGFLARGAEPAQAATWAAHVHAVAGERLARDVGEVGFLARELLPVVPKVLAELANRGGGGAGA